jgi:hypothetical protein
MSPFPAICGVDASARLLRYQFNFNDREYC